MASWVLDSARKYQRFGFGDQQQTSSLPNSCRSPPTSLRIDCFTPPAETGEKPLVSTSAAATLAASG